MKLYDVVNPSDAATMYAPSLHVAVIAALHLDGGRGLYAASAVDGTENGPCLAFSGERWLRENGIWPLDDWVAAHWSEIVAALESVRLGDAAKRAELDEALAFIPAERHKEFLATRSDRLRSSLNDFESHAHKVAQQMKRSPPAKAQ